MALKTWSPRKRTEQPQQARGMRQEAILAMPQPPHKADGITRKAGLHPQVSFGHIFPYIPRGLGRVNALRKDMQPCTSE